MLSHTYRISQHSSNIIKHINIISSVHKNYSEIFNGFLLIFQNFSSLGESCRFQLLSLKKPQNQLFIHKYLSAKLLIVSKHHRVLLLAFSLVISNLQILKLSRSIVLSRINCVTEVGFYLVSDLC